jgi:hypothetical protein
MVRPPSERQTRQQDVREGSRRGLPAGADISPCAGQSLWIWLTSRTAPRDGAGGERRIGLQRLRDLAGALGGLPMAAVTRGQPIAPFLQRRLIDGEVQRTFRNVDLDAIAGLDQRDQSLLGRFRRDMADGKARRAAREAPIGDQRAGFAEAFRFQIAGRDRAFPACRGRPWALRSGSPPHRRPSPAVEDAVRPPRPGFRR